MAVPDPYKAARASSMAAKASGDVPNPNLGAPPSTPQATKLTVPAPNPTPTKATATKLTVPKAGPAVPAPPNTPTSSNSSFIDPNQFSDWQAKNAANYDYLDKLSKEKFSYDPESDPGYQAQRQLAQLRAGDATKNAMEAANEKGVFGSSVMTSQLGQIQQRAEQEAAAYIPEYRNQAYGQFQDRLAAAGNLLNQSRALRGDQFNEGITEGQLTGNYASSDAKALENKIKALKQQAESPNITAAERAKISKEADGYRSQLQNMGYNTSQLGAGTSLANSMLGGTRTLAGQAQDYSQSADKRDFNEGVRQADRGFNESVRQADRGFNEGVRQTDRNFEYTQGRDKVADKRWQDEFDRIKVQDGIQNALAWASQNLNQSTADDNSAYKWAGLDAELAAAAKQGEKYSGMSANDIVSNVRKNFETKNGQLPTDTASREQMYMQIISAGLPSNQEDQALAAIGFTPDQIKSLDTKYLDSGK